ncbi:2-oxoglutarate dehydrogenase, E2 component, dihydrolipoamide succinyltransferase [Bacteriovorax sp. Seq25_V]|uniref:2-oxoglutarate dehydrogenase, E2 component, dihydrolipoamide succinyltransferase n=1 Tax=Bacteriovorax sp. Seq25_V TaxID=1201288 RepID=UPI00038A3BDD|nr:2-oxoglutarate dehydrogenase, E2 component, dihydrolipoamide succinyltransferase [Bacteriovorax sp. Seq25_V]EQC47580.1 2-oxoglutarate dehydrogenase, E2 component, dihydrolipoamide succinyltransferase [Bacteriovorax sp. Seq25_V]
MRHEIVMPQMGESITTGTITKWHKQVGETIKLDEVLLEISTDKVESEIPSPFEGKVVELKASEGDTIDVGVLIAVIDDDVNASASAPAAAAPAASAPAAAPAASSAPAAGSDRMDIVMPQMGESITTGTITKWHKQPGDMVEIDEILLDISTDKVESEIPSPISGRLEEVLFAEGETIDVGVKIASIEMNTSIPFGGGASTASAPAASAPAAAPAAAVASTPVAAAEPTGRRFYTPLVKALAAKHGVALSELANLKGSGAAGRVNKDDFMNYLGNRGTAPVASAPAASAPKPASASSAPSAANIAAATSGRVEIIPMDNMRKAIARNMIASKMTSPHVNSIDQVDMTRLVKFRDSFKNEFKKQEGFSLTYTHFILYALVQALKEFPLVNASIDGDNIIVKKDINLGCAVAVPGNGLVVPVIKGADNLNITGIARALDALVNKARAKKLSMDDLSGGTYTFTNNGSFGIMAATPVILQPQLGIFCVGTIKKAPVVTDDLAIAIRDIMYATHTYDHRLIDGELGSKFLKHVINTLETMDPSSLF